MSLLRDLSDLVATAPDAEQRATLDSVSAAVDAHDWYQALVLIDALPTGFTSWHERIAHARERIQAGEFEESSGFVEDGVGE